MQNRVCHLFGIRYPIIQGGMVWCSGWRLASAVSISYIRPICHFWTEMYRRGMLNFVQYSFVLLSRITVSLMPNHIRKMIYEKKLRNHESNE